MVAGGKLGGGERSAHTIFQYELPASAFPYAGSPLQLDFGEEADHKAVLLVEAEPGSPASVRPITLTSGRRLRTLRGNLLELRAWAGDVGDDWLRVEVDEPARAGLADEVREVLPNAVQVSARPVEAADGRERVTRLGRSPDELFAEYLAEQDVEDERLVTLFRELHDELSEAGDAA
jgi:exonuclease SbcD